MFVGDHNWLLSLAKYNQNQIIISIVRTFGIQMTHMYLVLTTQPSHGMNAWLKSNLAGFDSGVSDGWRYKSVCVLRSNINHHRLYIFILRFEGAVDEVNDE